MKLADQEQGGDVSRICFEVPFPPPAEYDSFQWHHPLAILTISTTRLDYYHQLFRP